MKIALPFLVMLFAVSLFSQSKAISFEALEVRKSETGTPVYYLEGLPFTGITYDFYKVENISLEHHLINGLLHLKEGFRNGQKIEYAEFQDGLLDGLYLKLFDNGQKYVEHHYTKGRMDGKQYGWKKDGTARFVAEYEDGSETMRIDYPLQGGLEPLIKQN